MLLDTHALLWAAAGDPRLSARALAIMENPANQRLISAVSALEIAIKFSVGRLDLPQQPGEYIRLRTHRYQLTALDITIDHAVQVAQLPHLHSDPFDRLLVAQALVEGLPIITNDTAIAPYGVETIW